MVGVALKKAPNRARKSETVTIPAPVGGVNARDALAAMPATDAIVLDNWFCTPSYVAVRNGCAKWATGLPGAVETVMAYTPQVGLNRVFGVASKAVYDGTTAGAVGAPVITGLSTSRLQYAMFASVSSSFLIWVSGGDAPQRYDGGVQGGILTTANLVGGSLYVNGTYPNVALTGGSGTGAQATIVVAGGAVTTVTITTPGTGYKANDTVSASAASLGGAGSGFTIQVQQTSGWSPLAITGTNLVPTTLVTVTVHQQRCWYIQLNSMTVWYAGAAAFQGTLTALPLGQLFKKGGFLMQMASWTIDNVAGINAYAAFITSEGEVALFQGFDPSQAATWSLVGVFQIGRPIGRRCVVQFGSDVLCITSDGLTPLSKELLTDRSQGEAAQLTYKIATAINQDVAQFSSNFGWQVIVYPLGNKLIVNVPEQTDVSAHQWVKNTVRQDDGGWSRFRGWNATCWETQGDTLYFGGVGSIYIADTGYTDAGAPITVDAKPAFSLFGPPGQLKIFGLARPIFLASAMVQPVITLNLDYADVIPQSLPVLVHVGAPWDVSPWDTTPWGDITPPTITVKTWLGVNGIGYAASGRISMQTLGLAVQWFSTDYIFQNGGPL